MIKRIECCYICGKKSSDEHKNGIDRYDNTKGYTLDNIRSCCWNCNFMKKNYDHDILINKFMLIYKNQKIHPIFENENKEIESMETGNKLTLSEKKEIKSKRKKEQLYTLREKYTNEETKKLWISEIVKSRIDKK
jgi:hypothetical protein